MFTCRNRHALAVLGLYVLGYGLVVAPLWHAVVDHAGAALSLDSPWVEHASNGSLATADAAPHEHPHGSRSDGDGHTHAPGAVEHLATVFVATEPPALILLASTAPVFRAATARPALGGSERHPAMPQGP